VLRTIEEPRLWMIRHVPKPAPRPTISARRLRHLALALIILGVVCRLVRYALHFPFWGDEVFLCVNFLGRDYLGLTRRLDCNQVAPLLFLWGEFTAFKLLGPSELALRLLPELAGLASLGLFWHLARTTLGPRAALLAVGLLATARWPVTMAASVKPYSFDLFFALALLVLAVHYLRRPERVGLLVLLALVIPIAVLSSYPSVFVGGGISFVLLPVAWRQGWRVRTGFAAYNLLLIGTFLACFLRIGREQLDPATGSVQRYMEDYWADAFPPGGLGGPLVWFVKINSGRMMAYPTGDANGGSTITLLFFLGGIWHVARQQRWRLLGLCLLPFALNLVAAGLRRYPYGGCCRLSQHLAPAICLLAGLGLARFLGRSPVLLTGVCCLLGLFGLGQLVADVAKPYRDSEALWASKLTGMLLHGRRPVDQVVIWNRTEEVESLLHWHLGRIGDRLHWGGSVDWDRLESEGGDLWCVSLWSGPEATPPTDRRGPSATIDRPGWIRAERVTYALPPWQDEQPLRCCELSRWMRVEKDGLLPKRPALGSWPP
jgi:hypothetical protein